MADSKRLIVASVVSVGALIASWFALHYAVSVGSSGQSTRAPITVPRISRPTNTAVNRSTMVRPSDFLQSKSLSAADLVSEAIRYGHAAAIIEIASPVTDDELARDVDSAEVKIHAAEDIVIDNDLGSAIGFERSLKRLEVTPGFVINVDVSEIEMLAADPRVININAYMPMKNPTITD